MPVILEISTDVTELIETEEKLRESNERLWIAFGQTPNIFWEVDLETRDFTLYTMEDDINTGIMKHNVFTANFPEGLIENGMNCIRTQQITSVNLQEGSCGGKKRILEISL